MIGDNIVLTVVEVLAGDKVRLGFDAPKELPIHREEIWRKIAEDEKR